MYILRHQYNSASPYESCGYERVPSYPQKGDSVTLLCRLEPNHPQAMLRLIWSIGDAPQQPLTGTLHHIDEQGRGYYSFQLPPLDGARVDYEMAAILPDKSILSRPFYIAPHISEASKLLGVWTGDQTLWLKLSMAGHLYLWRWEGSDGRIVADLRAEPLPCNAVPLPDHGEIELLPDITARVSLSPFTMTLLSAGEPLLTLNEESLRLILQPDGELHEFCWDVTLRGQSVFGMGERFNGVNQLGKRIYISSYEKFTDQGQRTYLPIPFFMTDGGIGVLYDSGFESHYTFLPNSDQAITAKMSCAAMKSCRHVLFFGTPRQILAQYHQYTGAAVLPPRWSFGPWMSSNRWERQAQAENELDLMQHHNIPATVFVLERWSDDTLYDCFEDLPRPLIAGDEAPVFDSFVFGGDTRWHNPLKLANRIHRLGMKLILWQAPVLRKPAHASAQCEIDFDYALEHRYCAMQPDGTPFTCPEGWFRGALLIDFSNPEASAWWMSKRSWLLKYLKADGFKTDSGELVTDDSTIFANGKTGREMRNLYTGAYEKAYADMLTDYGVDGVNYTRSGYIGAQRYPLHWTGDQRSSFAELRGQLSAILSAGLSGVLFMGTDLAGFAGSMPTAELYRRGVAFAAFSGQMQFHSEPTTDVNNDRSPWNMALQCLDDSLIGHYRRYANIRMALLPYIYSEAIQCTRTARPLMAHLAIDYPHDKTAWLQENVYLFGQALLVAPVLESGQLGHHVYFPCGDWIRLQSGEVVSGGEHFIYCDESSIPVYLKNGSMLPVQLDAQALSFGGCDDVYGDGLCFICTEESECFFCETPDKAMEIRLSDGLITVSGGVTSRLTVLVINGSAPEGAVINGVPCKTKKVCGSCFDMPVQGASILFA